MYVGALLLMVFGGMLAACSDDEEGPEPEDFANGHYDLWVSIGTGQDYAQLVKGVDSLDHGYLDLKNNGIDVSSKLTSETITKGEYYYQVSEDARLGKYRIKDNQIEVVREIPFTTFKAGHFTHAWVNDGRTLVLLGANGPKDKVIWVKVDAGTMQIEAEGTLDLPDPTGDMDFSTSGMAKGREDGTIVYSYELKKNTKPEFYLAVLKAADMSVLNHVAETRAHFPASTAYGELNQSKSFIDKNGDYYLACNNRLQGTTGYTTVQCGRLLRIKKGALDFDKTYQGYNYTEGKLLNIYDLKNGKALLFIQDPNETGAGTWESSSSYKNYYAVLDLTTGMKEKLDLPACGNMWMEGVCVRGDKAYIGVQPEHEGPAIYVYDIPTGKLTKGLTIKEGYTLDKVLFLED